MDAKTLLGSCSQVARITNVGHIPYPTIIMYTCLLRLGPREVARIFTCRPCWLSASKAVGTVVERPATLGVSLGFPRKVFPAKGSFKGEIGPYRAHIKPIVAAFSALGFHVSY